MEGSVGGPGCQGNRREGRAVKSNSKCCQVSLEVGLQVHFKGYTQRLDGSLGLLVTLCFRDRPP